MIIFAVILLILGILYVIKPELVLKYGKRRSKGEQKMPTVGAVFFTRMAGVFIIILSLYAIIINVIHK